MDIQQELERLRQQLRDAQQRAEEAEQQRQREQQRADAAQYQTRETTLVEYIEACHQYIFLHFGVETDKSLTSRGSITNPRHKYCPTRLSPWPTFLDEQRTALGTLYSVFPAHTAVFESRSFLRGLGSRIARKKVANEKDLEYFQHSSVEDPVRSIVEQLVLSDEVRIEFNLGHGIVFENHPNAISDVAVEVVERQTSRAPSRQGQSRDTSQLRPDQICVYRYDDSGLRRRSMAYVLEYKAPHKLTPPHLRAGLRPMDVHEAVVNRATVPATSDAAVLFQYHADRLVAAAVTQTFHYMIEGGLEYGLLTTGEAIVFLRVDWADPTTLYYHLAEPAAEVLAHPENSRSCTAVAQVLAFSLMALGASGRRRAPGQDERQQAVRRLKTWTEDYESILRSIPASERKPPPDSPAYHARTYKSVDRSPYLLRSKWKPTSDSAQDLLRPRRGRSPGPSDDESDGAMPGSPSPVQPSNRGSGSQSGSKTLVRRPHASNGRDASLRGSDERQRAFCTQKCLHGLVQGRELDQACPNVHLHRGQSESIYHPLSHADWLRLLHEQLRETLDKGVEPMGKQGARGALFRLTLLAYGYTFVGKGTVAEFQPDLYHEAGVYNKLRSMQGVHVPVFLGTVDLRRLDRTYYFDFRVRIVYMLLLSWGGDSLDEPAAIKAISPDAR